MMTARCDGRWSVRAALGARRGVGAALGLLLALAPGVVQAHCDTMDGPVVAAGREALERGDARLALVWVQPADEVEVKDAFARALAVRDLGQNARALADTYFLETLVRVHRAGEGAPYTGLKPAGADHGPAIPAVDAALRDGALEPVVALLDRAVHDGVRARFEEARAARAFPRGDVDAGRRYVHAYVSLLHYVEGVRRAAGAGAHDEAHGGAGDAEGAAARRDVAPPVHAEPAHGR